MNPKTIKLATTTARDRSQLPACPAVYFVLDGDAVLYIGRTRNLQQRWLAHHRWYQLKVMSGNIRIAWLECSDASLLVAIETASIEHFEPSLNRTKVGGEQTKIFVYLPEELKADLERLAKSHYRPVSNMVLTLIQEAVDEAKSEGRIQSDDRSQPHRSDSNEQDSS